MNPLVTTQTLSCDLERTRELERAGDHVANMAEDVTLLGTDEIARHAATTG